ATGLLTATRRLSSTWGQEIVAELHCHKGTGKDHAKFSPVGELSGSDLATGDAAMPAYRARRTGRPTRVWMDTLLPCPSRPKPRACGQRRSTTGCHQGSPSRATSLGTMPTRLRAALSRT